MLNRTALKKYLSYIGYALVLLSLYFLTQIFLGNLDALQGIRLTTANSLLLLILLSFHFVSYALSSYAWLLQLKPRYADFSLKQSYSIIGRSQIGKYLPGNIGHYVARLVLLPVGIGKADASYTLFVETVLMLIVASAIGVFYIFYFDFFSAIDNARLIQFVVVGAVVLALAYFGLKLLRRRYDLIALSPSAALRIAGLFILNLLLGGITIYLLLGIYGAAGSVTYLQCLSGYALSFVIGFAVPGAPGGIGIREFVFVLLFGGFIGEAVALEVILVFRVLNLVGDLLLFAIAYGMREKEAVTASTAERESS